MNRALPREVFDRMRVVEGDITALDVAAIVNAANRTLLGGGGVDGAIHRAAGPALIEACRQLGGAETGQVKATPGFDLAARWVLHAVGPVWHGGGRDEAEHLAACYTGALELCRELGAESVAFPAISTGIYGYPHALAARVATGAVATELALHEAPRQVLFCAFDAHAAQALSDALAALAAER
ncbi:MAG: O-acetyl-ADP-ribose deacetylase [Deltaproteobacteria bacterium]|nr:O-acetyl-ADP-ribose deacetylase [Deltaproteobacteria bacterium]MCB9787202.1 O-acetyl-ADP-ribose deacetylase [Deltaproteobacteria bacterium]